MIYKPSEIEKAIKDCKQLSKKKKWYRIEPLKEIKSLSQLRYIWLCFTVIAEEIGNDKDEVYHYYLSKFPTIRFIKIKNRDEEMIRISMSNFTQDEMRIFIDRVTIDASQDFGIKCPDPKDLKAINQYNYYVRIGYLPENP